MKSAIRNLISLLCMISLGCQQAPVIDDGIDIEDIVDATPTPDENGIDQSKTAGPMVGKTEDVDAEDFDIDDEKIAEVETKDKIEPKEVAVIPAPTPEPTPFPVYKETPILAPPGYFQLVKTCPVFAQPSDTSKVYNEVGIERVLWAESISETWKMVSRRKGVGYISADCFGAYAVARPRVRAKKAAPVVAKPTGLPAKPIEFAEKKSAVPIDAPVIPASDPIDIKETESSATVAQIPTPSPTSTPKSISDTTTTAATVATSETSHRPPPLVVEASKSSFDLDFFIGLGMGGLVIFAIQLLFGNRRKKNQELPLTVV